MKARYLRPVSGFVLSFSLSLGGCGGGSTVGDAGYAGSTAAGSGAIGNLGTGGAVNVTINPITDVGGQTSTLVGGQTGAAGKAGAAGKSGEGGKGGSSAGGSVTATGNTGGAGVNAVAGAGQAGGGGINNSSDINVVQEGPYKIESYTDGVNNLAYESAIVYYPTDAPPPYGAVVFSPGFTATKEGYQDFLGPLFASHGIVIMLTSPTTTADQPIQRSEDLQAAAQQILAENDREGSPLKGKLRGGNNVCVSGHSMGGGGSMFAGEAMGDAVKCIIAFQPWQPGSVFSQIKAPTLFVAAQNDAVAANAANSQVFYGSIPDGVPKYYAEVAGASHFLTSGLRGSNYDVQSKYVIAFAKTYLDDDDRYLAVLNAEKDPSLSAYEHVP
jgi:pimeloyl-ACP methyl ester carboxylesterase